MVHRIYPAALQLNKANASDTEAAFSDLNLSIRNGSITSVGEERANLSAVVYL